MKQSRTAQATRLVRLQNAVGAVNSADMARRLGFTQQRWSNYLHGRPLTVDVLTAISRVYPGIAWEWLVNGNIDALSPQWRERLYPVPEGRRNRTTKPPKSADGS